MVRHSLGFVYVLVNEAMPGIVKVGRTTNLAEDRAKQLFTTGVPSKFEVYSRCLTSDPTALEKAVHKRLAPYRVASNREFFRVSPETATDSVLEVRAEVDGIEAWSATRRVFLRSGDRLVLSLRAGQMFMLFNYPSPFDLVTASAKPYDFWQAHADGDTLEIYSTHDAAYVAGLSDNDPEGTQDPVPHLNREESAPNDVINGRERLVPGDRLLWMDSADGSAECTSVVFEASDYCQVIGRTRDLQFSPEGFPLLINFPTRDPLPPGMVRAGHDALKLLPRSWSPHPARSDGLVEIGNQLAPPEYWLTQLAKPRRDQTRGGG